MDVRLACLAWIASPLMAGCAASPTIDLERATALAQDRSDMPDRGSATELARRSQLKLTLGKRYLSAGEAMLGGFLIEQAKVDSELASMKSATSRLRTEALHRVATRP